MGLLLLSASWLYSTQYFEDREAEVIAVSGLDLTLDELFAELSGGVFGLGARPSIWISIDELASRLEGQGATISDIIGRTDTNVSLTREIARFQRNVSSLRQMQEQAREALRRNVDALDEVLRISSQAAQELDSVAAQFNLQARSTEELQKELAASVETLTVAALSASRLERNLRALSRYNSSDAAREVPLFVLSYSTVGLPAPCQTTDDDVPLPRSCVPSTERLFQALGKIEQEGANPATDLLAAVLAVSAYERVVNSELSRLRAEQNNARIQNAEVRAALNDNSRWSSGVARLTRAVVEAKAIVEDILSDAALPDPAVTRTNMGLLLSSVRIRISVLNAVPVVQADALVATQSITDLSLQRDWEESAAALTRLDQLAAATLHSITEIRRLSRELLETRNTEGERSLATLINISLAFNILVLAIAFAAVYYGGRLLIGPLAKITDAIFAMSTGDLPDRITGDVGLAEMKRLQTSVNGLIETEKQFRFASELANLGRWSFDLPGKFNMSTKAREILDTTSTLTSGGVPAVFERIAPDQRTEFRRAWQNSLKTGEEFRTLVRLPMSDGTYRDLAIYAEASRDGRGVPDGMSGIVQDVSEYSELRDQLAQAQKLEVIGQLTSGVAHDFNNALSIVLGNLELLEETATDQFARERLKVAIEAATRGSDLARSMLSFARKAPMVPAVVDLKEVADEAVEWVSSVFPANKKISLSAPDCDYFAFVDRSFVQSAMLNLLVNARDAIDGAGEISIALGREYIGDQPKNGFPQSMTAGEYISIEVRDSGSGISDKDLARIFDPFFSTKEIGARSGLGLPMVKSFMEQSGGCVTVQSTPGEGSAFKLYFSSSSLRPEHQSIQEVSEGFVGRASARVLLVEDDPQLKDLLAQFLRQENYEVEVAESADQALSFWQKNKDFDVIVADKNMPGAVQGDKLLDLISGESAMIPTVLMTGDVNYAPIAQENESGIRAVILKPVRRADFLEAIRSLLDQAQRKL